jgi:hypothetical protein
MPCNGDNYPIFIAQEGESPLRASTSFKDDVAFILIGKSFLLGYNNFQVSSMAPQPQNSGGLSGPCELQVSPVYF